MVDWFYGGTASEFYDGTVDWFMVEQYRSDPIGSEGMNWSEQTGTMGQWRDGR